MRVVLWIVGFRLFRPPGFWRFQVCFQRRSTWRRDSRVLGLAGLGRANWATRDAVLGLMVSFEGPALFCARANMSLLSLKRDPK